MNFFIMLFERERRLYREAGPLAYWLVAVASLTLGLALGHGLHLLIRGVS